MLNIYLIGGGEGQKNKVFRYKVLEAGFPLRARLLRIETVEEFARLQRADSAGAGRVLLKGAELVWLGGGREEWKEVVEVWVRVNGLILSAQEWEDFWAGGLERIRAARLRNA